MTVQEPYRKANSATSALRVIAGIPEPQKPPPHNYEAEQGLLGALLADNDAYGQIAGYLQSCHFFDPLHARIFETIEAHIRAGRRVTAVILKSAFEHCPPIDDQTTVGQYLGMLLTKSPTPAAKFAFDYARNIRDLADRRGVIIISEDAASAAYDCLSDEAASTLLDDIERKVSQLRSEDASSHEEPISAASLHGKPVPSRDWHVAEMVPAGDVTLLGGDGGTGKSLLGLQMGVCTVARRPFLGRPIATGPVLFVSAEDELAELHRRLADITSCESISLSALEDLHLISLVGTDAVMATFDRATNVMTRTATCRKIIRLVEKIRPRLLVLDTLADLFGGDEINRSQTRQFVQLLRSIAVKYDATVILLAHPSVAGMKTGTGTSGSTAWSNSVRSRLYLERVKEKESDTELDPDARILTTKKANYGRCGVSIPLRWHKGAFRNPENDSELAAEMLYANVKAENAFLDLLRKWHQQGREVSPNRSPSYAPTVFSEEDPIGKSIGKQSLAAAMNRLLAAEKIKVVKRGPPSRSYERLELV